MVIECDVLVVGGGPAGSVAALSAIHHGSNDVLVVEKKSKIGESASPKVDLVEDIGLKDIFETLDLPINYKSHKSRWYSPSNTCFSFDSKIDDLWIKRGPSGDSFENRTMDMVTKKGARLLLSSEVVEYKKDIITVKGNDTDEEIRAKVIIDAEGLYSKILNSLNLETSSNIPVKEIICYGQAGYDFDMEVGVPEIFFDSKYASGSYVLVCKDPKDGMGYIMQGNVKSNNINPRRNFQKLTDGNPLLKDILKDAKVNQKIHGILYFTTTSPQRLRKDNVLFIGDSARLMDPFLHYGVRQAIISGYLSGKMAAKYLSTADESYLNKYESYIKEILYPELKRGIAYRRIFSKLNDRDIEKIFRLLNGLKERDVDFDVLFERPYKYLPQISKALIKNLSCTSLIPKVLISSR